MSLRPLLLFSALLAFGCWSPNAARGDDYDVQEALYDEPVDESYESENEGEFPYKAYINGDSVHVRSGPGQNYYTVLRMKRGEPVYVYRHDPGGWCAIRPPAECFSWISADFIEPGEGRMATVKGDRVVARVGSAYSDIRDVIQIRLDAGEQVEVIEARRLGNGPAAQTWYKIVPPAGEFRWISGQYLDRTPPGQQAREVDPNNNLVIAKQAREARRERSRPDPQLASMRPGAAPLSDRYDRDEIRDDYRDEVDLERNDGSIHSTASGITRRPKQPPLVEEDAFPVGNVIRRRGGGGTNKSPRYVDQGEKRLRAEVEQLDLDLSASVAQDPANWDLKPLKTRSESLLSQSETALDRGRVRLVQRKITRFEEIKQRQEQLVSAQQQTDAKNQELARATLGGSPPITPNVERYDGVGRLTQVDQSHGSVASFALVDGQGVIKQYVTPAPGVNLRQYVGRDVGVQGTLGYMTDARTQHVTAKRVTVVEGLMLR
ncbi:MAG TPA: hypothetical protein VGJ26_16090 [Pirellulales bacterium]|jgi:hypothetical protein